MVSSTKQILRQQIRQMLKLMSNEERIQQSTLVMNDLLHHPKYLSSHSISIYVHMVTEVSTREIIADAFQTKKHVFIPRYQSTTMDMVRVYSLDDLDALPMTKWNIRQPALNDTNRELANENIDLIIVPGLAFSLDGSRLGHGKGFYDRYLKTLTEHSYTISLAYRQQILAKGIIPMNPMDVPIKEILVAK